MYNNRNYERSEYGRHIQDEQMYRDAARNLRWNNGRGQGERWKKEDLIDRSGINFNEEYFTPYDYAYAVNAMYADYGKMTEKPEPYEQMAKDYLRNDSFPERGDERAYYDAARRSRRYYNRYDDYPLRSEYNYENRRGYNERGTYRDRDNDGRYNE